MTALHIQLSHPSCHQLKMVVKRYLYALDLDKTVSRLSDGCHSCAALQPHVLTSPLPHHRTLLVARLEVRPMDGPPAVMRTDPAPGLKALVDDPLLKKHRITIELGQAKNPNKNPVAERAVQELETELLRQEPLDRAVSPLTVAVATSALHCRIRSRGLSSREMWTQRDQFSNQPLPLADDNLIALQHEQRLSNHPHSERSKDPLHNRRPTPLIDVGDLVYLHSDRNKSRARDRPFCSRRYTIL